MYSVKLHSLEHRVKNVQFINLLIEDILNRFVYAVFSSVYRFPNYSLPKSEWSSTLQVKCGWAKQWDPSSVSGCVDPRGCTNPPPRSDTIWGSFEDDPVQNVDVGSSYWYSCRSGVFEMPDGTTAAFIYLTCVNSDSGGAPYWNPPYDYDVNPFPPCKTLGKCFEPIFKQILKKHHGNGFELFCVNCFFTNIIIRF